MAESFKDKLEDTGQKVAETANKVGHKVGEKVEEAADWAKETAHKAGHRVDEAAQKVEHKVGTPLSESTGAVGSVADIREHLDVYASCGTKVGRVDHVEGDTIKLTKNDSPDGQHHFVPTSWVDHVDNHVHLKKNSQETEQGWKADAASCSTCGG